MATWIRHSYKHVLASWTSPLPPTPSHPSRLSQSTRLSSCFFFFVFLNPDLFDILCSDKQNVCWKPCFFGAVPLSYLRGCLPGYRPQTGSNKTLFYSYFRLFIDYFHWQRQRAFIPQVSFFFVSCVKTLLSFLRFYCCIVQIVRFRASQSSWENRWVRFPGARLWLWSPTEMAWTCPRARSSESLLVWLWALHLTSSSVPGGCRVCIQEGLCHPALRLKPTWGFCIHSRKGLLLCADTSPFQYVKIMTLLSTFLLLGNI